GRIGEELEVGAAAAPDIDGPSESGEAVNADDVLPATRAKAVARDAENRGALETRAEQELRRGCWSDGYDHYGSKGHSHYADRVQVEILLIDDDLQQVLTRSERNVCLADPLEGVPVAGVGHADGSRHVLAVDLDVEGARRGRAADAQLDVVLGAGRYADGVGEPFAGFEVVHHVAAAQAVGGQDDVHVLAGPVLPPGVAGDVVVIGDAFSTEVEVLRLEASGHRDGRSGIGGRGSDRHPDRVQIEILLIGDDLQQVLTRGERNACLANPLESLPAAGVGNGDGSRHALTVDLGGRRSWRTCCSPAVRRCIAR